MERPLRTMVSSKVLGQLQDSQHVAFSLLSQRFHNGLSLRCALRSWHLVKKASSDLKRARRMPLVPQATRRILTSRMFDSFRDTVIHA